MQDTAVFVLECKENEERQDSFSLKKAFLPF